MNQTRVKFTEVDKAIERSARMCTKEMAVINVAEGCMFGCLFCGVRHRGRRDDLIRLRSNLPDLLQRELATRSRNGNPPVAFVFNTSTDSFQPIAPLISLTHETMRLVLEAGYELHFFTRGIVPEEFGGLFGRHADKIHAQVSFFTMDENLSGLYEPGAASPQDRLSCIRRLIAWGVDVRGRIDPLIPFLSDTVGHLEELLRYLKSVGVTRTFAAYLTIKPHMLELFEKSLPATHFHLIKGSLKGQAWRKVGIHQMTKLLPERTRTKGYQRLVNLGKRLGMEIDICACQDPSLGSSCLVRPTPRSADVPGEGQLDLFIAS